ncbi:unnamed protein product, partial [marine sediment metagenome]
MSLADIQEKKAEERKREKRLVHVTNALTHDFLQSKSFKSKPKTYKDNADYIGKSFLDYLFFEDKKELRELNNIHIRHFMFDYAPRRLTFTTENAKQVSEILAKFLGFLETEGHIKNGSELSKEVKGNNRAFLKLIPKRIKTTTKKADAKKTKSTKRDSKKLAPEIKVGRNDPCPCGSGK